MAWQAERAKRTRRQRRGLSRRGRVGAADTPRQVPAAGRGGGAAAARSAPPSPEFVDDAAAASPSFCFPSPDERRGMRGFGAGEAAAVVRAGHARQQDISFPKM